ncbi:hypothetical protein CB1_000371013 [Camelus ferus]|nr:hypothetical protein CB1_000371013 [Camelus ferus]
MAFRSLRTRKGFPEGPEHSPHAEVCCHIHILELSCVKESRRDTETHLLLTCVLPEESPCSEIKAEGKLEDSIEIAKCEETAVQQGPLCRQGGALLLVNAGAFTEKAVPCA